jgi:hypothetical protein
VARGVGLEFKPQYHKNKTNKQNPVRQKHEVSYEGTAIGVIEDFSA